MFLTIVEGILILSIKHHASSVNNFFTIRQNSKNIKFGITGNCSK